MVTRYKIDNYMKLSVAELDAKLEEQHEILEKIWKEDDGKSYERYQEKCQPHWDEVMCLDIARTMLIDKTSANFTEIDNIGDLMTVKDFESACKSHAIMGYDGFGYYADKDKKCSDIEADPKAFELGYIRSDFEYVIWYNR